MTLTDESISEISDHSLEKNMSKKKIVLLPDF